jgi:uncharacterized DUF497 family protein
VFRDAAALVLPDDRQNYGEPRSNLIGADVCNRVLTVTFTQRKNAIRLISARPASREERSLYHDQT